MEYPTDVLFDTIIRYESFTNFLSLKHNEWKVLLKTGSVQTLSQFGVSTTVVEYNLTSLFSSEISHICSKNKKFKSIRLLFRCSKLKVLFSQSHT